MFGAVVAASRLQIRTAPKIGIHPVAKKQCLYQGILQCKVRDFALSSRNIISWRATVLKKSLIKNYLEWSSTLRRMSLLRPKLKMPNVKIIPTETNPLKVNTKIQNNVMLYRFEKPYLYKGSIIFAGIALVGCLAMADNVYLVLCRDLFNSTKPLLTRLHEHLLPLAFIAIGLLAGPGIFFTIWFITRRTVKYIVLHKGGKTISMILYHPLKGETTMTLDVNNVSALTSRAGTKAYIPLKIRDTKSKYIVDKNGHFVNPELFDVTVGIQRFS